MYYGILKPRSTAKNATLNRQITVQATLLLIAGLMVTGLNSSAAQSQDLPSTYPSHYFAFTPADSANYTDIYPDHHMRNSVTAGYRNAYKAAQAIEEYALQKQNIDFLERIGDNQKKWRLTLTSGQSITIAPTPGSNDVDYTFEHYYPSVELIVFRAQWYEGNNYVLVSRKDGSKIQSYGPPHFSPAKKYFLTYNGTEISDYSYQGIQLFEMTERSIQKLIEYDTDFIPSRCRWLNDDTFQLEIYKAELKKSHGIKRIYKHYRVNIHPTNP